MGKRIFSLHCFSRSTKVSQILVGHVARTSPSLEVCLMSHVSRRGELEQLAHGTGGTSTIGPERTGCGPPENVSVRTRCGSFPKATQAPCFDSPDSVAVISVQKCVWYQGYNLTVKSAVPGWRQKLAVGIFRKGILLVALACPCGWGGESSLGRERHGSIFTRCSFESQLAGPQQITLFSSSCTGLTGTPQSIVDAIIKQPSRCIIKRDGGSATKHGLEIRLVARIFREQITQEMAKDGVGKRA